LAYTRNDIRFLHKTPSRVAIHAYARKILNLPVSKIASVHRSVLEDQKKNTDLISTRLISTSRKDMKRDNAGENKNDKKKQDWDTRLGT